MSAAEIAESYFMELIDRSMILPNKTTYFSQKVINSCQVHDLMREISISKAAEENLVFRLEAGCRSNTNGTARHLSISANWRGDEVDFKNMVDISRIRSLTVFGKWKPFFISDKMRFLRVLDLQDTRDLCNHHLEHIGKLVHLRYLSLRGCPGIYHLPDSVGSMRQLQTLDIRLTWIAMLPKTIIKLKQLQYLRVGGLGTDGVYFLRRLKSKCAAFCSCQPAYHNVYEEETWLDRCAKCWYVAMPGLATPFGSGIPVPRGAGNMKALHTLGEVDIGSGNALKEIKRLTQLRKLKVSGINEKNCHEFCSALEALSCLESLSMSSSGNQGNLRCLSDAVFSPPKNLRTFMLFSDLGKMPAWIMHLRNLVKLRLMCTHLTDSDDTMQLLGNLPDLAILTLDSYAFEVQGLCLNFVPEAFPSLVALDLCSAHRIEDIGEIKSVEFKQGTTPKLEMLKFRYRGDAIINDGLFSGLASLPSLKKFQLSTRSFEGKEAFVEHVRAQLALNPNRPVLIKGW
jgi:hypothetical protein